MEIRQVEEIVKSRLSAKRYEHSKGTMKKAEELAIIYGEKDLEKVKLTAIAHDIGKEITKEEMMHYAEKNGITLSDEDIQCDAILHSIIGAKIAKQELGFTEEMARAIYYHTTGGEKMSLLDKIIFIADKIEEGRKCEWVEEIRELAKQDLDLAIKRFLDISILDFVKRNRKMHSLTCKARNSIIIERQIPEIPRNTL